MSPFEREHARGVRQWGRGWRRTAINGDQLKQRAASRTSAVSVQGVVRLGRDRQRRVHVATRVHKARSYPSSSRHRLGVRAFPAAPTIGDTAGAAISARDGQWLSEIPAIPSAIPTGDTACAAIPSERDGERLFCNPRIAAKTGASSADRVALRAMPAAEVRRYAANKIQRSTALSIRHRRPSERRSAAYGCRPSPICSLPLFLSIHPQIQ